MKKKIPTLVKKMVDGDEYVKVTAEEDLVKLVIKMGWDSLEHFTDDTGAGKELVGEWFNVTHGRVYPL